jgi:O-antigen/teichoic acid export membrane protein
MRWLYGASFAPAGLAFAWLIWVPALNGIHGLMLHAMNALGKTRLIAAIFFANLLLNVALNLALVPRYGYVASAALSALCEVVVMLGVLWVLRREGMDLGLGRMLWPSVPAAALMAFALLALPEPLGWQTPFWVFLGALIYALALATLGFFGAEERGHLMRLLGRAG